MRQLLMMLGGVALSLVGSAHVLFRKAWPRRCEHCRQHRRRALKDGQVISFCALAKPLSDDCPEFDLLPMKKEADPCQHCKKP